MTEILDLKILAVYCNKRYVDPVIPGYIDLRVFCGVQILTCWGADCLEIWWKREHAMMVLSLDGS
jgi:hypothetical protein